MRVVKARGPFIPWLKPRGFLALFCNGGEVQGRAAEPATGTYSISDASIAYSYGFESFMPGPGDITSLLQVTWWQVTDFQQVKLTYSSYTETPVVWSASAG
jgi:hypothetical protein